MDLWNDRVGSSTAWAATERAQVRLAGLVAAHPDHAGVNRAARVIGRVGPRLKALDPDLARPAVLEALGSRIDEMVAAVSNALEPSDPNAGPIPPEKIANDTDNVVDLLLQLPAGEEEAVALADAFRAQVGGLREEIEAMVEGAQTSINATVGSLTDALGESDTEVQAVQVRVGELEASLDSIRSTVEESVEQQKAAATTAASNAATEHANVQERAQQAAKVALASAKEDFTAEADRQKNDHETLMKAVTERADGLIGVIQEKKEQVERLAGAVGRTGLSAGFQDWEKAEGKRADDLRDAAIRYGLGSALAVVVLLIVRIAFKESDTVADADALLAAATLSIPAALGGLAVYAGRESSKHRRNETIARRTEIELNSFLPFLAELDTDDRDSLTILYTDVFFGQASIHTPDGKAAGDDGPKPLHREALERLASAMRARRESPQEPA